jgi:hypothetical protein
MSLLDEETLTLRDAAKIIPGRRPGKKIDFSTLFRWANKGIRGPSGERVRLETLKAGGFLITSREAIDRFFTALSARPGNVKVEVRTPSARQRASELAVKKLEEMGI